jgi:hypothetical protein
VSAGRYRPADRYSAGLILSLAVLGSVPACHWGLGLQPALPLWACLAAPPAVLLLAVWLGISGRAPIGDLMRSLSPPERVFSWVAVALLFTVPSLVAGRFEPLAGLLAVMLLTAVVCGSESGGARYMLVAGAAFLVATDGIPAPLCHIHLGVFAGALAAALAYGSFFAQVEPFPDALIPGPWRPLRIAVGSAATAGILTVAALWLTPRFTEIRAVRFTRRQGTRWNSADMSGASLEVSLLQMFFATVLVCIALVALVAVARWLYQKFRHKPRELMPESIGVPVGGAYRLDEEPHAQRRRLSADPREAVAQWYERFAAGMAARGAEKPPAATAEEYLRLLVEASGLPEDELRRLTGDFVRARYAPEEVTRAQARSFARTVRGILARAGRRTE